MFALALLSASQTQAQVTVTPTKVAPLPRPGVVTPVPTTQQIALEDINDWLCPQNNPKGDREFGGHGPRVKCEVKLQIGADGHSLLANITFWAQETEPDFSTATGEWTRKVYDAPYGKRITRIVSDKASRTQFISPPAGEQFVFPGADVASAVNVFLDGTGGTISSAIFALHGLPPGQINALGRLITRSINNGNTVVRVPATEGTLVRFFHIVGDTGADDISTDNNCNDDTRIVKIEFAPVQIELVVE
jgi:hypothetical protein